MGNSLLEVGPGPGLTTDVLRTRTADVTALEIDPRLADSLRGRLDRLNVRVVEGNATEMPFDDSLFSAVVAMTMLHHVPSCALQDRLLAGAYRVLQPGGVFAGTDNTWNPVFGLLHLGDVMVPVNPETLPARLEAVGFGSAFVDRVTNRFRFRARIDFV